MALSTSEKFQSIIKGDFAVSSGLPLPFGATVARGGINFAVFSKHATNVRLVLYSGNDSDSILELPFDPHLNRTGSVWLSTRARPRSGDPLFATAWIGVPNEAPLIHPLRPYLGLAGSLCAGGGWAASRGVSRTLSRTASNDATALSSEPL